MGTPNIFNLRKLAHGNNIMMFLNTEEGRRAAFLYLNFCISEEKLIKMSKQKKCKICGEPFTPYKSIDMVCSFKCGSIYTRRHISAGKQAIGNKTKRKKPIKKVSEKRKKDDAIYKKLRLKFLDEKVCFIEGCNRVADTIEHAAGRVGYADEWARSKGITLYLDVRYWRPCCWQHNQELETNPELSKKYQFSKLTMKKK